MEAMRAGGIDFVLTAHEDSVMTGEMKKGMCADSPRMASKLSEANSLLAGRQST
jgi:hypothetical protein